MLYSPFLHIDGEIRTEHFALEAGGAVLRAGDDDGEKPFLGDFRGLVEHLLRAGFQTNIAALAPFLVNFNSRLLFHYFLFFFQILFLLSRSMNKS